MSNLAQVEENGDLTWLFLKPHKGCFISKHKLPMYLYKEYGLDKEVQTKLNKMQKLHQQGKIKANLHFEYEYNGSKHNIKSNYVQYEYDFPNFERRIEDGGAIIKMSGKKMFVINNVNNNLDFVKQEVSEYLEPENSRLKDYECFLCGNLIPQGTGNVGYILDKGEVKYCHHRCLTQIDNSKSSIKRLRDYASELNKLCDFENLFDEIKAELTQISKDNDVLCNYIPNVISDELLSQKVLKKAIKLIGNTNLHKAELEQKAQELKLNEEAYNQLVEKATSRYLNLQVDIRLNDNNNVLDDISTHTVSKFSLSSLSSALANIFLNSKELRDYFEIQK